MDRNNLKVVVFHPAIAPYRIDFLNSLSNTFDTSFYFEFLNVLEQDFNQSLLGKYINFKPNFLKRKKYGFKNLRWDIIPILKKEKPDVVFCSEFNLLGVLVIFYKYLFNRKLKIVSICDDNKDLVIPDSKIKKLMKYALIHLFDAIVLVSIEALGLYKKQWSHIKSKFVYFPIIQKDNVFRTRLKQAKDLSIKKIDKYLLENKKIVLYIGRLIDIKNIFLLIDAFSNNQTDNSFLVIVGDGYLKRDLKLYVKEKQLEHKVLFTGKQEDIDLYSWYNIGQIFILPSYYERFGAVVNEALLSGCFTICSDIAGASCLIEDGNNGFVFKSNDSDMLSTSLAKALEKISPIQKQSILKPNRMLQSYNNYYESFITELTKLIN